MPRARNKLQIHVRTSHLPEPLGQAPRRLGLAHVITPSVTDRHLEMFEAVDVVKQLAPSHEARVQHVVHLHDGERNKYTGSSQILLDNIRIDVSFADGQFVPDKRRGRRLPRPRIVAGEPFPVGTEQIPPLPLPVGRRVLDVLAVHFPRLRILSERPPAAEEIVHLVRTEQKHSPQQQRVHPVRIGLRVRQRQEAPPRSPQHQSPFLDVEVLPKFVDIFGQLRSGIPHEGRFQVVGRVRDALSGPALVENDDFEYCRVEEPPHTGANASAGPPVKKDCRNAVWIAAHVVGQTVSVTHVQESFVEGFQLGIKIARKFSRIFYHAGSIRGGRRHVR
mmetsp:Transcript_6268/g.13135  ORF Transcript_6268/g.13135 Transcript_6268/m.13135 type:complete len:334 (-) Transcript_6268:144-1145(-)